MIRQSEDHSSSLGAKILFTGMMGSGKSTSARIIGARLGIPVVDLDALIEHMAGMTIAEIFSQYGERRFRSMEYQCLDRVLFRPERALVALGGGTNCQEMNRALIRPPHLTVYLRCEVDLLVKRLEASGAKRPLLGTEGLILRERIVQLLEERQQWYELADYVVEVSSDETYLLKLEALIRSILAS